MAVSPAASPGGAPSLAPHAKYDRLFAQATHAQPATTIVVHPCDETSLRGPLEAAEHGIIVPTLVGPRAKIEATAARYKIDVGRCEIVDVAHRERPPPRALPSSAKGAASS